MARASRATDPAPLKVKEVRVEERRYVVCVNRRGSGHRTGPTREAIVAACASNCERGDKSLVGNKGYRRYLKVEGEGHFAIDEAKIAEEARYDGTWVLRTNTDVAGGGGGAAVQAAVAGGAVVPQLQVAAGDAADLSSA